MERVKCACKECTEQYLGCHSDCEKYKEYRNYLDEKNKAIRDGKRKAYGEFLYHRKYQV